MQCVICKKLHSLSSPFCGLCAKWHFVCARCGEYRAALAADSPPRGDRKEVCTVCLLSARGICTHCRKAIFDSDMITQRVGRRGASSNLLCPTCFQEGTPLLHTELTNVGTIAWSENHKLLDSISKLVQVLTAYTPIFPSWANQLANEQLGAICQALPKAPGHCYISVYPDGLVSKSVTKPKGPPCFRFPSFMYPGNSTPAANAFMYAMTARVVKTYTCYVDNITYGWPVELFEWLDKPEVLLEKYPSPLNKQSGAAVSGLLLIPVSILGELYKAIFPEGGK